MAEIIVIDDSRYARDILRGMLESHGHSVQEAADGLLGLKLVSEVNPDLITLDMTMPEMDGLSVLKTLQQRHSDVPTIVISADIQTTTREACLECGADAFLNKPAREEELIETIERLLGERTEASV